jgi:hypothetical protein
VPQPFDVEYFFLRYVPDPVCEDFVTIGVVMIARNYDDFAQIRFLPHWEPVLSFDPGADVDLLNAFVEEMKRQFQKRESCKRVIELMKDSFSNSIQLSMPTAIVTVDPNAELDKLFSDYLSPLADSP